MIVTIILAKQQGAALLNTDMTDDRITAPLVEVPTPHGDLIDSDDVIDEINRVTFVSQYDYNTAYNIVEQADAVIEAEE